MEDIGGARWVERLSREHADRLYAYCLTIAVNSTSAGDAVHDTFIVAAERIGELRDHDQLAPWLYALARHSCLHQPQRAQRRGPARLAPQPGFHSVSTATETTNAVLIAMANLSDTDREVVELSVRHRFTADEIALVLGSSPATVADQLSGALDKFNRTGPAPDLLDRYAAVPWPAISAELWQQLRVTRETSIPALLAEVARRVGPFTADGFPRQLDQAIRKVPLRWLTIGGAVASAVLFGAGTVIANQGQPTDARRPIVAALPPLPTVSEPPPPPLHHGSPEAAASSTKPATSARASDRQRSASTNSAPPRASTTQFSVKVKVSQQFCWPGSNESRFTALATTSGAPAAQVWLYVEDSDGGFSVPMTSSAGKWQAQTTVFLPTKAWYVIAKAVDGRTSKANGNRLSC